MQLRNLHNFLPPICQLPIVNCPLVYGICKLSHLIAERGAGFDLIFSIQNQIT